MATALVRKWHKNCKVPKTECLGNYGFTNYLYLYACNGT